MYYYIYLRRIIFVSTTFLYLSGCAELDKLYNSAFEGKPPLKMTVADLEDDQKRIAFSGRMLTLQGNYHGIHSEIATYKNQMLKDVLIKICDKNKCSTKFYLIWSQKEALEKLKIEESVEVSGYLTSLSRGGTPIIGSPGKAAIVARSKSDRDHFWVLDINEPTPDYSKSNKIPVDTAKMVQTTLNTLGYNAGIVDGVWGPKTSQALQSYQIDNNLHYSGNLDEETLKAIKKEYSKIREQ